MAQPVKIKSRFIDGGVRILRPIGKRLIVEREPAIQSYGVIIGVANEGSVDVTISKVLSMSDDCDLRTRKGPVKIGDRVLAVRVVNRRSDSIEARSEDGQAIAFLPAEHALAVMTDEEILPINDLLLVEAAPDRRMVGAIEMVGYSSTDVHSSKVLATGPDVVHGEPGQFSIHIKINGVEIDSPNIKRRFGSNLKLIREKSTMGISHAPVEDDPTLESNPDPTREPHRGLAERR